MDNVQYDEESKKQAAQSNYSLQKMRQEEKRKIQEAIVLSKKEEAKQAKFIKQQNELKKRQYLLKV